MDADRRRLEREWIESGNGVDRIRILRDEIRRGHFPQEDALRFLLRDRRVTYAVTGAEEASDEVEDWIDVLARVDEDEVVRASIVGARLVLPAWRLFRRNNDPDEVFDALERSLSRGAPIADFSRLRDRFSAEDPIEAIFQIVVSVAESRSDRRQLVRLAESLVSALTLLDLPDVVARMEPHGPKTIAALALGIANATLMRCGSREVSPLGVAVRLLRQTIDGPQDGLMAEQPNTLGRNFVLGNKPTDPLDRLAQRTIFMARPITDPNEPYRGEAMAGHAREALLAAIEAKVPVLELAREAWREVTCRTLLKGRTTPVLDDGYVYPQRRSSTGFDGVIEIPPEAAPPAQGFAPPAS